MKNFRIVNKVTGNNLNFDLISYEGIRAFPKYTDGERYNKALSDINLFKLNDKKFLKGRARVLESFIHQLKIAQISLDPFDRRILEDTIRKFKEKKNPHYKCALDLYDKWKNEECLTDILEEVIEILKV